MNGFLTGRHQAIVWTNAGILLIGYIGTNSVAFDRNSYIFMHKNAFEIVVCKMTAILSQFQWVNN